MRRGICSLLILVMLALIVSSCSARSKHDSMTVTNLESVEAEMLYDYQEKGMDKDFSSPMEMMVDTSGSRTSSSDRKTIKTVDLVLETKAFEQAVADITAAVTQSGGYIESSYVSGESIGNQGTARYANFTVRIPVENLDSYLGSFGEQFNILSRSENANDITDTYYDTQARLNSLLTQEERLLAMLENADELQYMLQLESTLADVRYQIENYYSTIQRYDSQVAMSTVTARLTEVVEYKPVTETPKTFGERVGIAFQNSWENFADGCQNFVIGLVYALPVLLILLVIVVIIIVIIWLVIRAGRKKIRKTTVGLTLADVEKDALRETKDSQDTHKE